jgi:ATP-dependent Clp protease protease subunit
LNEIYASHTGQSVERIEKDSERDFFMSPFEAKEYGLIDEVVIPRKK